METLTLEFDDGTLEVDADGLRKMESEYFNALLNSDCKKIGKIDGVSIKDFQVLYENPNWEIVLFPQEDLSVVESKCNKLILIDRFQMKRLFEVYARNLAERSKYVDYFPPEVIQLLCVRGYDVRPSIERWAELICVEGFPIDVYLNHGLFKMGGRRKIICDHPDCTPTIIEQLINEEFPKEAFYGYVMRGLLDQKSVLKCLSIFDPVYRKWKMRVKKGTSPLEFDMVTLCWIFGSGSWSCVPKSIRDFVHYEMWDKTHTLIKQFDNEQDAKDNLDANYCCYAVF